MGFFCKKRVHPKDGSSGKGSGEVFWSQAGSGQIEKHVAGRLRDFVGRKFWEVPNTVAYKRTAQFNEFCFHRTGSCCWG